MLFSGHYVGNASVEIIGLTENGDASTGRSGQTGASSDANRQLISGSAPQRTPVPDIIRNHRPNRTVGVELERREGDLAPVAAAVFGVEQVIGENPLVGVGDMEHPMVPGADDAQRGILRDQHAVFGPWTMNRWAGRVLDAILRLTGVVLGPAGIVDALAFEASRKSPGTQWNTREASKLTNVYTGGHDRAPHRNTP